MTKFFTILLLIFIVCIIALSLSVWKAYAIIRRKMNQFNSRMANGNSFARRDEQRETTTDNGDTIVDSRNQQQANKKIFAQDEGEYVDFKEDKA